MFILFQPACFSSSGSDQLNICKFNSKFSQRRLFHPSQVVFVFPALPPFSSTTQILLIMYPSYGCEVSPFFSINVLTRWLSWRWSGVSCSSFFVLFLLRWIQFKLCRSYPFLVSNVSHAIAPLNHSLLAIDLSWSAQDISEDVCLHYQSVQAISRLLSH